MTRPKPLAPSLPFVWAEQDELLVWLAGPHAGAVETANVLGQPLDSAVSSAIVLDVATEGARTPPPAIAVAERRWVRGGPGEVVHCAPWSP